ncbi:MAG: helix-hairpin-helix domain-containing protein, partial [Balneolaceae bacterium]
MCISPQAAAQERDFTEFGVQEDVERIYEDFDPDDPTINPEQMAEFLQELARNPVNINRAGLNELMQVPGLDFRTSRNIIEYRNRQKPFEETEELMDVKGIGKKTYEEVKPYVTTGSGGIWNRDLFMDYRYWISNSRFEVISRYQRTLEQQQGFARPIEDGGYLGSPYAYYHRFRYYSDHLSANFTQEKDPGELLRNPGDFDFNSWHIALENNGRLKRLVVGDYTLSFGQGLVLWGGGAFGRSSTVKGAIGRNERGIKPYT